MNSFLLLLSTCMLWNPAFFCDKTNACWLSHISDLIWLTQAVKPCLHNAFSFWIWVQSCVFYTAEPLRVFLHLPTFTGWNTLGLRFLISPHVSTHSFMLLFLMWSSRIFHLDSKLIPILYQYLSLKFRMLFFKDKSKSLICQYLSLESDLSYSYLLASNTSLGLSLYESCLSSKSS